MTTEKTFCITAFLEQLHQEVSTCVTRAEAVHVVGEYSERAKALQEAGKFSDGYHTFEELYAHRVRLFTCLMHTHSNRAWWSEQHSDGSRIDNWIIAGISTPEGDVTYHLPTSEIEHLPPLTFENYGKPWDGHTAADVLERLLSLNNGRTEGTAIEPVSPDGEELAVYQYAASVNLARGTVQWDGVVTARLITGIESYRAVRAEIARDGNVTNPEQVQVHNLAMIGFVPAKAGA